MFHNVGVLAVVYPFAPLRAFGLLAGCFLFFFNQSSILYTSVYTCQSQSPNSAPRRVFFFFAILNKAAVDIHVQLRFHFSEMSAQGQRVLTLNIAAGENKMFLVPESQEKCLLSKGGKSRKN